MPAPEASGPPDDGSHGGRRVLVGVGTLAAVGGLVLALRGSSPALSDEVVRGALEASRANGPVAGSWVVQEPQGERQREFAADPKRPERLLCRMGVEPGAPVAWFPRSYVGERLFGAAGSDLVFANYVRDGAPVEETVGGRRCLRVTLASKHFGERGPRRRLWVDPEAREVLALEDRGFDGELAHAARYVSSTFRAGDPAQARVEPGGSRQFPSRPLEEIVAMASIPIYEPSSLPAGFRRVSQSIGEIPVAVDFRMSLGIRSGRPRPRMAFDTVEVVDLRYSDGVALMHLQLAATPDLRRYETVLAEFAKQMRLPDACPGTDPAAADELMGGDDSILVRRRADKCRTVLKVEDLDGVSVVLRTRNDLPGDAYVAVIRSLRVVPGSKPSPKAKRDRSAEAEPSSSDLLPVSDGGD